MAISSDCMSAKVGRNRPSFTCVTKGVVLAPNGFSGSDG
jgi:hypothetical protein